MLVWFSLGAINSSLFGCHWVLLTHACKDWAINLEKALGGRITLGLLVGARKRGIPPVLCPIETLVRVSMIRHQGGAFQSFPT
jgi:hypothetical protein